MKNMRLSVLILLIVLGGINLLSAQGVKISANPGNPDPSAMLEVGDSTKGFLLPRMTTAQRNAIVNPAIGLQIVNITTECVEVYFTHGWKPVMCDCSIAPAQPGAISGPAVFCENQANVTYSISPVFMATSYTWTVPPGATLISGQGTTSITVNYTTGGGTITVLAENTCGQSPVTLLNVSMATPSAAFSPSSATVNLPQPFTAQPGYTSYTWNFPSGTPASSFIQNPVVTWSGTGVFPVSLIVVDNFGCSDTVVQSVNVVNCQPYTQTFTPCGATGRSGPNQTQADNAYGLGIVSVSNGIQQWTVPATGLYRIEVAGAQGGGSVPRPGGLGARMIGEFNLNLGDVLNLLVGQTGEITASTTPSGNRGGGGGSFVWNPAQPAQPLIVAGGGGGTNVSTSNVLGVGGTTATGGTLKADNTGSPGSNGNGANAGGAGYLTNSSGENNGTFASAALNGGVGADGYTVSSHYGGFGGGGGGGGSPSTTYASGGGGGYSGGAGQGTPASIGGGGGGSFNAGANQTNTPAVNPGMGYIVITRICP